MQWFEQVYGFVALAIRNKNEQVKLILAYIYVCMVLPSLPTLILRLIDNFLFSIIISIATIFVFCFLLQVSWKLRHCEGQLAEAA